MWVPERSRKPDCRRVDVGRPSCDAPRGTQSRLRAPLRKEGTRHGLPAPFSKLSREVTGQRRIRLFLDSNVLTGGIVSPRGLDKATLSLRPAKVCSLVLPDVVRDEVADNLFLHPDL